MGKACGNPKCCVSTGIHDGLTFGSGDLDPNGFWEYPCAPCARRNEELYPEDGECWPFKPPKKPTREQMILAANHVLDDAQEGLDKVHNLHIIEGEGKVADAVARAKYNLGKVKIPNK